MTDLIQSLSQTPLPTILVVAGILFLFLSIGGRLGAQIATDTIKRKFAGLLGLMLLIGGISLYFAGQLPTQAPRQAAPAKTVEKNAYQLRASSVPSGRTTEGKMQFSLSEGTLTFQSADQVAVGRVTMEGGDSSKLEILSSSQGRPTALKKTILADSTTTTIEIAGNVTNETANGPLAGHTILIEKQDGIWSQRLLDAEPTEEQRTELRSPYADEYETYPAGMIEVGATWKLDGPQLASLSGLGNLLSVDGSATMTFEKLVDGGEEKFAAISVKRMELEGTMLESGTLVRFKIGGSGMVQRSLSRFIDTRLSFEGTMVMDEEILVEGKKVKMNIVGTFKASGDQNLITE